MTAILPDAAARIRVITALVQPRLAVKNVPGPVSVSAGGGTRAVIKPACPDTRATGPGTRNCVSCGQADRLLIDTGLGTWCCLNIERCQP